MTPEHRRHEGKAVKRAADWLAKELGEHAQIVRANCSAGTLTAFLHDPAAPPEKDQLLALARTTGLDAEAKARLSALTADDHEQEALQLTAADVEQLRRAGVEDIGLFQATRGAKNTREYQQRKRAYLARTGRGAA